MTRPSQIDFEVYEGMTFTAEVEWLEPDGSDTPVDGKTARMQLRKTPDDDPIITLTTENGGIVLEDGLIRINITATQADLLDENLAYDIVIYDGAVRESPFAGHFLTERRKTRES